VGPGDEALAEVLGATELESVDALEHIALEEASAGER